MKHFAASAVYTKLAMNIDMEICHPREKRSNVRAFLRMVKTTLQDLKETVPDIPLRILNKYVEETHAKAKAPLSLPPLQSQQPNLQPQLPQQPQPQSQSLQSQQHPNTPQSANVAAQNYNQPTPLEQLRVIPNIENDDETDIQDEFAAEVQKRLQIKKQNAEEFQIQRMNEHDRNESTSV